MNVWRIMKTGDWLLIGVSIALAIALAIGVWLPQRDKAGLARVYRDNRLLAVLPLDKDGEFTIEDGKQVNVVEVNGGRVRMRLSNCPDEYCVRQGYVSANGAAIVCLPHRVCVELESGEESGLDAIAS